jgi:hypothetical protein
MLMSAIIGLLIGMTLGQRYSVLTLAPVFILILFMAFGAAVVRPDVAWSAAKTAALVVTALQVGYLLGVGIRFLIVWARASRRRTTSLANSLPEQPAPRRAAQQ